MNCVVCGKPATKMNKKDLPVCSHHANASLNSPLCPRCGIEMVLRDSKYGKFFGCKAFPMCDGTKKI